MQLTFVLEKLHNSEIQSISNLNYKIMKTFIMIIALLISQFMYGSIDTTELKSKITDVTVFFSGAQVTRSGKIKLEKGKHILSISNLPKEVNTQSIQVQGVENVKILSVKHYTEIDTKKSPQHLVLENELEALNQKLDEIRNEVEVFQLEERLLLTNSKLSRDDQGSSIGEIKEAADYYRQRLNEIRKKKLMLFSDYDKVNKQINSVYANINKITVEKRKAHSRILIALECEKYVKQDLKVSYYLESAGWKPTYDFRVDDVSKPLKIVYNANVFQSTGEDWKNINIRLSTSKPSLNGEKPKIKAMYLGYNSPYANDAKRAGERDNYGNSGTGSIKGRVFDSETLESIPFCNVVVEKNGRMINGGVTNMDGQYTIRPLEQGLYNVKLSYIGYEKQELRNISVSANKIRFLDFNLKSSATTLDAFCVSEYKVPLIDKDYTSTGGTMSSEYINRMPGRSANSVAVTVGGVFSDDDGRMSGMRGYRSSQTATYIDGVRVIASPEFKTKNYIANSLKSTITNLEYDIQIPYSIPSDGEDYNIKIKEVSMDVEYIYHAIPRLDNDVFLTAEITDWSELNLLSGKSSIYYLGTFSGNSYIDVQQTDDTMSISLGRDRNIIITREGKKELYDKQVVGRNIRETRAWEIIVRNNKSVKIRINIEDQYPLSDRKSYVVELLESSNAKVNKRNGALSWEIELEPSEKKVLNFQYSVKYPKYMNLAFE